MSSIAVATPSADRDLGMRGRFGIGGEAGGWLEADGETAGAGILGIYMRLGLQVNNLVGLHLTGAASTLFLASYGRVALVIDFAPVNDFAVGTGLTVAGIFTAGVLVIGDNTDDEGGTTTTTTTTTGTN